MGAKTGIEWTDSTWNPTRGCSRVSEGCRNCYAEAVAARFSGHGQPYEGLAVMRNGKPQWTGELRLVERHLEDPLRWQKPRKIFVNSMSDLFHEKVPFEWLDRIFAVMALADRHTFQILTKRPERMLEYCRKPRPELSYWIGRLVDKSTMESVGRGFDLQADIQARENWPLRNVWLGVSIEDEPTRQERVFHLRRTPAAVRFVSYEPALGPISLAADLGTDFLPGVDWVIAGGESGPRSRPSHPDWFRKVRDDCAAAGVPFFFKQWGEWMPIFCGINPSKNDPRCRVHEGFTFPKGDREEVGQHMWRVGKKATGRLLDGREHNEFPEARK